MMNMDITSKSAYKLLQQLESDPQLQSVEDTTILNDEQYPIIAFESAITNLKDIISLISAVTILRWDANTDSANLTKDQIQRMRVQRQKTVRNLCLNPTVERQGNQHLFGCRASCFSDA